MTRGLASSWTGSSDTRPAPRRPGREVSHAFASAGTHQITIVATDNTGRSEKTWVQLPVAGVDTPADPGAPSELSDQMAPVAKAFTVRTTVSDLSGNAKVVAKKSKLRRR